MEKEAEEDDTDAEEEKQMEEAMERAEKSAMRYEKAREEPGAVELCPGIVVRPLRKEEKTSVSKDSVGKKGGKGKGKGNSASAGSGKAGKMR